ncbi:hypothetical protein MCOR02_006960 [Pyricularia oryzae]|nr:hypothetical protein MCOR02_006960 [Pyricularia oryzae]
MSCFGTNFVVTVRKLLHRQIRQHVPTSEVDPTLFKTTLGQKFGPQGYSLDADLEKCRPKLFEEVYEKREEDHLRQGHHTSQKHSNRLRLATFNLAFLPT